jgi:SET domain-containing protein
MTRAHRHSDVAIDGAVYGNWTRFVNSHCVPNVYAATEMIGQMFFVVFTADKELKAGEQLFISYGPDYFLDDKGQETCECSWKVGPHAPPKLERKT